MCPGPSDGKGQPLMQHSCARALLIVPLNVQAGTYPAASWTIGDRKQTTVWCADSCRMTEVSIFDVVQNRRQTEFLHAVCWISCSMMRANRAYKISVLGLCLRVVFLLAKSCSSCRNAHVCVTFKNRPWSEFSHAVCWISCSMMRANRAYKISVLGLCLRVFLLLAKSCSSCRNAHVLLASCLTPKLTRARPSRLRELSDGDQTCVCMCACRLIQPICPLFRVVTHITLMCSWGRIRVLVSCLTLKLTRARPSRLRELSHGNPTCVCMCACCLIQPICPLFCVVTHIPVLCSWGRIRGFASCLTLKLTRARPSRLRELSDGDQTCVCMCACCLIQPICPLFRVVTHITLMCAWGRIRVLVP